MADLLKNFKPNIDSTIDGMDFNIKKFEFLTECTNTSTKMDPDNSFHLNKNNMRGWANYENIIKHKETFIVDYYNYHSEKETITEIDLVERTPPLCDKCFCGKTLTKNNCFVITYDYGDIPIVLCVGNECIKRFNDGRKIKKKCSLPYCNREHNNRIFTTCNYHKKDDKYYSNRDDWIVKRGYGDIRKYRDFHKEENRRYRREAIATSNYKPLIDYIKFYYSE